MLSDLASYAWTKVSGPTGGTVTSPSSATTTITALSTAGTYVFQLAVTDNSGAVATDTASVVVTAANIAPTANAGSDKVIVQPTNTTTLTGSGTDTDGTITAYLWTKISGQGTITSTSSATTTITGLSSIGSSTFQLQVTDNSGATALDTVLVTVNAAGNASPTANAGIDQTITLPTSQVTLSGSGTDADGTIASYAWTKLSGSGTITTPSSASTTVTGLTAGTSTFQLTVTDNGGATGTDTVVITTNALANTLPIANAGTDISITLPTSSVTLSGSGTDTDGTIASYAWTKLSGSGTITSPSSASTTITGLTAGTSVYRLTVIDNSGGTAADDVNIVVAAAPNIPPVVTPGVNQSITLPTNSITLAGSATDSDGTIASHTWTKVSGSGTITTPSSYTSTITGLTAGTSVFQLSATDNSGATTTATMNVTVNAQGANIAPIASAGADQTLTLPTTGTGLSGSGTDSDGTIASYLWTLISGPTTPSILTPSTSSTSLSNLSFTGSYTFRLTVTDNLGATGSDEIGRAHV